MFRAEQKIADDKIGSDQPPGTNAGYMLMTFQLQLNLLIGCYSPNYRLCSTIALYCATMDIEGSSEEARQGGGQVVRNVLRLSRTLPCLVAR